MNNILKNKKMQAAKAYLARTGRNLIDEIDDCLVYEDDGTIAVCKVSITTNPIIDEAEHDHRMSRKEFEDVIYQVMLRNSEVIDCYLRPDTIELFVMHESRAILKHGIDVGVKEV